MINQTDRERVSQLIEVVGIDNYRQMFAEYCRSAPFMAREIQQKSTQRHQLHPLKSMCYAVGLQSIGLKIQSIEDLLSQGAQATASTYIEHLEADIKHGIEYVDNMLGFL